MKIKILGTGCPKCQLTYKNVLKALEETDVEATVEKVEQIDEITAYNVFATPALLIDNEIKVTGRVPHLKELKKLISQG